MKTIELTKEVAKRHQFNEQDIDLLPNGWRLVYDETRLQGMDKDLEESATIGALEMLVGAALTGIWDVPEDSRDLPETEAIRGGRMTTKFDKTSKTVTLIGYMSAGKFSKNPRSIDELTGDFAGESPKEVAVNCILVPLKRKGWEPMSLVINPNVKNTSAFNDPLSITGELETPCFFRSGEMTLRDGTDITLIMFCSQESGKWRSVGVTDLVINNAEEARVWLDIVKCPSFIDQFMARFERMAR